MNEKIHQEKVTITRFDSCQSSTVPVIGVHCGPISECKAAFTDVGDVGGVDQVGRMGQVW